LSDLINKISSLRCFSKHNSVSEEQILSAENELGVRFAEDYRECLSEFGQFTVYGHEITGITNDKRLDVVSVTKEQRDYFKKLPDDMYVIDEAHIDGIIILQNTAGEIFVTKPNSTVQKIAESLVVYLEN
jgi:hypothetical protein